MTGPGQELSPQGATNIARTNSDVSLMMLRGLPADFVPGGIAATSAIDFDTRTRTHLANVDDALSKHSPRNPAVRQETFKSGGKKIVGNDEDTSTWALKGPLKAVGKVLDPETQEERYQPEGFATVDPQRGVAVIVAVPPLKAQQDVTILQYGDATPQSATVTLDNSFPPKEYVTPDLPELRERLQTAIPDNLDDTPPLSDSELLDFYTQFMGPLGEAHARAVHNIPPDVQRPGQQQSQKPQAQSADPGMTLDDDPAPQTPAPVRQIQQAPEQPLQQQQQPTPTAAELATVYSDYLGIVANPRDIRGAGEVPEHANRYYEEAAALHDKRVEEITAGQHPPTTGYSLPFMPPATQGPILPIEDAREFYNTLGAHRARQGDTEWAKYCQQQLQAIAARTERSAPHAAAPQGWGPIKQQNNPVSPGQGGIQAPHPGYPNPQQVPPQGHQQQRYGPGGGSQGPR